MLLRLVGRLEKARPWAALAAFCSTQLPLVVAITTIAVHDGHMRTSTASALVGAGIVSTLVLPLAGLRLRRARIAGPSEPAPEPVAAQPAVTGS